MLSGGAGGRKLQILIYHRVLSERDPLQPSEPTIEEFEWQMDLLARHFTPLTLESAIGHLRNGTLPPRAVSVTFDDGYADNLHLALPVMRKHGFAPTVFIATAYLDGGIMFNDIITESIRGYNDPELDLEDLGLAGRFRCATVIEKQLAIRQIVNRLKYLSAGERAEKAVRIAELTATTIPNSLMLSSEELVRLSAEGAGIGAHTVTHPIMKVTSDADTREEIVQSRGFLQDLLQKPIDLFAYPNGVPGQDYSPDHPGMLRELGFKAAVSTAKGVSTRRTDMYQLRRFTPWDKGPAKFLTRLLLNYLES